MKINLNSSAKIIAVFVSLFSCLAPMVFHAQIQNYFGLDQTPLNISKMRSVDMDLDGDPDLVMLNLSKQRIECYENLGGGNFAPLRTITRLNGIFTRMEVGNFIGGPAPDVLLYAPNTTNIVLEGSGNYSFINRPQSVNMPLAPDFTNYSPADLDGDGYDEFAWLGGTEVKIWKGSSEGLTEQLIHNTNEFLYSLGTGGFIHYGDYNNDGLVDLACPNGPLVDDVVVLLNQGQLNFSTVVSAGPQMGSSKIPPADINNDGNLDLFYYPNTNSCWVSLGDGQGGFGTPYLLGNFLRYLTMGDYNNDGLTDYVSSHPVAPVCTGSTSVCDHQIVVSTGNANGTFSSILLHTHFHGTTQLQMLECTGDDYLDIVFIGQKISANIFVGSPTGFPSTPQLMGSLVHDVRDMGFYDADGDGLLDVFLTDYGTMNANYSLVLGGLSTIKNLGGGRWSNDQQISPPTVASITSSVLGDFDLDGVMDIFYRAQQKIRHVKILPDQFTEEPMLNPTTTEGGFNLIVTDIIGDGVKEVFTGGSTTTANSGYYRYNGSTWTRATISNSSQASLYISHDINQDGRDNIIFFTSSNNRISYVPHTTGETAVAWPIRSNLPVVPTAIYAFDYDGDGDPDIVYRSNNQLFWLRNDGTFPFEAPQAATLFGTIPSSFKALLFDDLNGDQRTDLVILNQNELIIRMNQGNGSITEETFERSFIVGESQVQLYAANTSNPSFKDIFIVADTPDIIEVFYHPTYYSVCQNPSACNYSPGASPFGQSCIFPTPTDFNCSGSTNTADLIILLSQFGCIEVCPETDLNDDNLVNIQDLMLFLEHIE